MRSGGQLGSQDADWAVVGWALITSSCNAVPAPPCKSRSQILASCDSLYCINLVYCTQPSLHRSGKSRVNYDDLNDADIRDLHALARRFLQVGLGGGWVGWWEGTLQAVEWETGEENLRGTPVTVQAPT